MTDIQDEDIEALTSLGLTMLQATVYLTLIETENSTIKDIAKNTGIARQDLYRITSELQDNGLLEQIITKPIMYKPIPLTNGVNILLNDIHKKRNETHKKAKHLLQRHKTKPTTQKTTPETNQFILVPGKNALILKEKNLLNNAQKTVSIITSKQRFSQKLYSLNEELKKAITKGTKIRILMEKNNTKQNQTLTNNLTKTTKDKTNFEIRYITTPSPVILCLFDNKDVLLITTANAGLPESPALWSNNPSLTELAHNYFEILWITAIETNTPNPTTP